MHVNKTDLAPYVGADVERMIDDANDRRHGPVIATAVTSDGGVTAIASWLRSQLDSWTRSAA